MCTHLPNYLLTNFFTTYSLTPRMCVNDEHGAPICDANGVPFGGFAPSTKLLELQALGPLYISLRPLQFLYPPTSLIPSYCLLCRSLSPPRPRKTSSPASSCSFQASLGRATLEPTYVDCSSLGLLL